VAKNNQRDPNLRAATVARVNQLVKTGLTKAGAFEKISDETGRAKDAVQMLYYRAVRAEKGGSRKPGKSAPGSAAARKSAASPAGGARKGSRKSARSRKGGQASPYGSEFPALLNGIAAAINELLKHVEKTVEENRTLKLQSERFKAIKNLVSAR